MPYDDDSAKLAQMKAFLLSQSLYPKEETFDDGAYLLNQNPDMQQVALKVPKIPKVLDVPHNPSRRTMGLNFTPQPENLPVPVAPQKPAASPLQTATPTQPVQPAQPANVGPLSQAADAILNMPMSRRQVLQTPINAAVSHYGRKALGMIDPVAPEMTPIPEAPVAMKTDTEIADAIAKYAGDMVEDTDSIGRAFSVAVGDTMDNYFDLGGDEVPIFSALSEISIASGDPKKMSEAAKAAGLDIESISRATGLSVKEIARVVKDDSEVLEKLANTANSRNYMEGILEDGRPKEAYRSTSLESIDANDVDNIIDSVIKEYGKDADENDILHAVSDKLRTHFFAEERKDGGDSPLGAAMYQQILDDGILDEIYEQGVLNVDFMGLTDRVLDKLHGRTPKKRSQVDEEYDDYDEDYDE